MAALAALVGVLAIFSAKKWPSLPGQDPDISSGLGPLLSADASILLPGSGAFDNKTIRWQEFQSPTVRAVVVVATEQDVQQTV